MAPSVNQVLAQMQRWTAASLADLPDALLLERYLQERDQAAFAALVARYGGLVLRVCRRILGTNPEVEDVFQATFIVLARKAASLRQPKALAGWLHSVARRIALRARSKSNGLISSGALVDTSLPDPRPDPLTQLTARELLDVVDEEVKYLPRAQRSAVLLCCLEGHSREEAARILGWTPGAVKNHLQRGRQRLQARLARRGITLSAALALVEVSRGEAASALLVQNTVKAALGGSIGNSSAILAHGFLKRMLWTRLAGVVTVLFSVALAASTAAVLFSRGSTTEAPQEQSPALPIAARDVNADKPKARVDAEGDPLPEGALLRLGSIRYRAGAGINHAALSPDGKLLAMACESGITFFDLATGKPRHLRGSGVRNGFDDKGSNIALSPDGKQLVHITSTGNLRFWDVATGKRIPAADDSPGPPDPPRGGIAVAVPQAHDGLRKVWFPPQGRYVIAEAMRTGVFLVDPSTGGHARHFNLSGELSSVASDGKKLVSVEHAQAVLYDDHGKELRRFIHEGKIEFATLWQAGKTLITVNEKSEIKIWDVATGKEQRTIAGPQAKDAARMPTVVSIAPDGNILFIGTRGGDILRWDLRNGKEKSPLCGHTRFVTGLFPLPDGQSLVSVGWDNLVRRWDLAAGKEEPNGEGYTQYLVAARSPDGRSIITANQPGRLEFWDATTGKRLGRFSLPVSWFSRLRFSPDGKHLALGCSDARVRIWDVDRQRVTRELKLPPAKRPGFGGSSSFEGLSWSPNGRFLVTSIAHEDGLWMWEAATGKEMWRESGQGMVAFSPDGKTLVTGGWDACLTFRDAATGKARSILKEERNIIDAIVFSPDGATLATCHHGGNVYLRDPETGVVRKTLRAHRGVAWSISFSPDGNWLASSGDNTVCVWEVATGAELLCRKGHEGRAYQAEFGTDGRTVLSCSGDLTALLWDIRPPIEPGRNRTLESLWADLADEPLKAYRAVWELAGDPKAAGELLRNKLAPAKKEVDEHRLQALVADLDSDEFAIRQKAAMELEKAGEQAIPVYRKALAGKPSLESRRRLEDLLAKAQRSWEDLSGERLRSLRAIEALELGGSKEARTVLETLAAGAAGARLTEQAKAALDRLTNSQR